jgi:hypothetical protein
MHRSNRRQASRPASHGFFSSVCAFRFLRQPSGPKSPMPLSSNGSVAGGEVTANYSRAVRRFLTFLTLAPGSKRNVT